MAETVVPILISLAPYILEGLSGEGYKPQHIPQHVWNDIKNISRFSPPTIKDKMSLYGYGYRYPRAEREVRLLLDDKFARAKILNRAIAAKNPWIQHLRKEGVYDQIAAILREAKKKYKNPNPVTSQKSARSRRKRLEAELEAIEKYGSDIGRVFQESGYGSQEEYQALLQSIKNKLLAERNAQDERIKALEELLAKK
jgi:hypothetical protein